MIRGKKCCRYIAPEVQREGRYNRSVDVFSFALVLLEVAVGDLVTVRKQFKAAGIDTSTTGWTPNIPEAVSLDLPDVADLFEECFASDYRVRPNFVEVEFRLKEMVKLTSTRISKGSEPD